MYNITAMATKENDFLGYYNKHKDKIYNYFWYRVGFNRALAEDLTSEVFLKAYKNFDSFDPARPFQAWIYAVAKNHLLNYYRLANRETELFLADSLAKNQLLEIDRRLELERIFNLINSMADYYKEVLFLRFADGLDNKEIAEALGKEEGAIRTQISRALEELRSKLEESGEERAEF